MPEEINAQSVDEVRVDTPDSPDTGQLDPPVVVVMTTLIIVVSAGAGDIEISSGSGDFAITGFGGVG